MRKWLVRIAIVVVLVGAAGGVAVWQGWVTVPWTQTQTRQAGRFRNANTTDVIPTVPVQRADRLIQDLQLTGKLTLSTVREVKAPFGEAIATINVAVGDMVQTGDVLATLDRAQLSSDLDSAWLELTNARQALVDLMAPSTDVEKMAAQADLLAAQEDLTTLEEGPAATDVSAAALAIQDAQLTLQELQNRNDPNSTEVRQARYNLQKAENAVHDAQVAYDAVSWRGEGAATEASALQNATISLESTRLTYEEAIAPPDALALQKAQLAVTQAQNNYNQLFKAATPAQLTQAQVRVTEAQDALQQLEDGPSDQEIQQAEATVLASLTAFEETRTDLLSGSDLVAPLAGLVTQIPVSEGAVVERGDTVAVVAALDSFEINLSVSEEYILLLKEQMPVAIAVDVAPNLPITGTVAYIARVDTNSFSQNESTAASGNNSPGSYPVRVDVLDSPALSDLRAGMNVQVTFLGSNQLPPNSWLVPANSIRRGRGDNATATIQILRGETPEPLAVTVTDITQGEWQVVVSPDLSERDRVVGTVTSFLDNGSTTTQGGFGGQGRFRTNPGGPGGLRLP
ncbi:MAG: HlyD family efflux transporter periplasmic adaptor subunit [Caldilineaceae bacterium]